VTRLRPLLALVALPLLTAEVRGACPPARAVGGGGPARTDCLAQFAGPGLVLNVPAFDPADPKPAREAHCFDGDAGCDRDGLVNGVCEFPIDVCLRTQDPALPKCAPADVTAVVVKNRPPGHPRHEPALDVLQAALAALLPATGCACTSGQTLPVPAAASAHRGRRVVRVVASAATATDRDRVKLRCLAREWPAHGYDHANTRATPVETTITPANVAQLVPRWQAALGAGVTSTPTVGNGLVHATAWNGIVTALAEADGSVVWQYDTGSGGIIGVQSSATLTPDGRLLVGDSAAVLHCLDAATGAVRWTRGLGDPNVDHVWASPTVANGRVFIGIASHNDNPCTKGRLVALDLDTGAVLWTRQTVPDRICDTDTAVICDEDADCGGGGSCVVARGAGVTATVAVDRTGEAVFMNTVGCFTFPSVGDSDSIFRLEAATGAVAWVRRVDPREQFRACSNAGAIDCTSNADCGAGTCQVKAAYHDFGFLNGPILVDAADGPGGAQPLVVSGSKNGTLYALDPADGTTVWTHAVRPAPVTPAFAGFGLFNGAVGFASGRFHAALFDFIPSITPPPSHLMAFASATGATAWEGDVDIGVSWGSVGIANGVVFVGALGAPKLYAYDAATGTRLAALDTPAILTSGPSIVRGTLYVGYGITGPVGGVMALALP
jgi:outer membrane protein assembly factor BamB